MAGGTAQPISVKQETNFQEAGEHPAFKLELEERIGHILRRAYQRHVMIFQAHLQDFNLTAAQVIALAHLAEQGVCSQSDLVRFTAIDHTTIRGIINRLKKRGLLKTKEDSTDARKVKVCLTPQGESVTTGATARIEGVSEETYNGLNENERVAFKYLLRRIADLPIPDSDSQSHAGDSPENALHASHNNPKQPQTEQRFRLQLDERIGYLLRRAYQRHVTIFQHHLNPFQLTAAQYIVLATLVEQDGCSQSDLVRHTVIDHTTIRGIISRLGKRGLLTTKADPTDARKVNAVLTPEGEAIAAQASAHIDTVSEETFNGINSAERVALLYLLRRIANIPIPGS